MLRHVPNILTLGRFVLTVVFLIMLLLSPPRYAHGEVPFPGYLDIAFILFVVAGLTDIVDGTIARKLNVASKFGRMLDPLADKVLVCGAFICFAIIGRPRLFNLSQITLAAIQWTVVGIIILREVYVTVLRHIAEARGVNFAATVSGKIKMFLQSFAIGTVVIKIAHVQTVTATVLSGLRATQRDSWKKAAS
ncbi:MAG: CDP-alcohol phosphatidyltransferase family protein [Planctomycetota bacterium]